MEQLQVELVIQNIAQWLVSEQCIGPLTLVCKKWYRILKNMHLEQYHQFKHGKNRILQSIDNGFVNFCIYKPILSTSRTECIQYASVQLIKYVDPNSDKSINFTQDTYLIKCTEINTNYKTELQLEQRCNYILSFSDEFAGQNVDGKNNLRNLRPIVEEIKEDYPTQLIIEARPHFHEIVRRSLSPPPLPRKKTNSKNLIRKYVKRYKTAGRMQLITNRIHKLIHVI
jgi:hypothetical protein